LKKEETRNKVVSNVIWRQKVGVNICRLVIWTNGELRKKKKKKLMTFSL